MARKPRDSAEKPAGEGANPGAVAEDATAASADGAGAEAVPATPRPRRAPAQVVMRDPSPRLDCGRYPVKRCAGDTVSVSIEIVPPGHEVVAAVARWREAGTRRWQETPLRRIDEDQGGDRWGASFPVTAVGVCSWSIQAWIDEPAGWRREVRRKLDAGQKDLGPELAEGAALLAAAAERATGLEQALLERAAETAGDFTVPQTRRIDAALDPEVARAAAAVDPRRGAATLDPPVQVRVDRPRARFGAWYEVFPRSWGGLRGTADAVPEIAALGFDVLYLAPIHPIGRKNRKGPNNSLEAGPDDPGSPWAIGAAEGGHEALHPELGSLDDFAALVAACADHEIELALDLAFQCSADHPWLTEHPEWFKHRPDGTLKYAENPPKRYQDIYNFDFHSEAWASLWKALLEVTLTWARRGVKIFRVDNPHTKPIPFWEWLIASVHDEHPDVVFLAEAFTRRSAMRTLAKSGFSQSYTYFTWKNSAWELREYMTELATESIDYFRPNFFANTPDILHEYLQLGGRPAFEARLVLAGTLSPSYGIYSGFEACENVAVAPGSEEYLDSEKYEVKERRLEGPLLPLIAALNRARRAHPALQRLGGLSFLDTANDALLAYARREGPDIVICAVNLDPHEPQAGLVDVRAEIGAPPNFRVRDELDGRVYDWHLGGNFIRLAPGGSHVLAVMR